MKITCSQRDLSHHLAVASRAVASRPSVPVLANILLVADEAAQTVTLSAFDLSLGIQTSFPAQIEVGGTITLPSRLLNEIVAKLPDGDVVLEIPKEKLSAKPLSADQPASNDIVLPSFQVLLKYKGGKCSINGMSANEFPELPLLSETSNDIDSDVLINGLKGVLFAASDDETKQVLTGVHVSCLHGGFEFAATDGHRLAVMQIETENADILYAQTVPSRALQELTRMLEKADSKSLSVSSDSSQAVFEWSNQRLTTRLLEGQYPNYGQLIPKQFSKSLTVDRRSLMSALERIAVLADQKNNIVKFSLNADAQELTLSVDAPDVGSGVESLSCAFQGADIDIAFNVKYLLEGLKAIPSSEVLVSLNTARSPVVITPIGGAKQTYLLMPVQIRS